MAEINRTYDQNRDTYMAAGITIPFRVAKNFLSRDQVYNTNSKLVSEIFINPHTPPPPRALEMKDVNLPSLDPTPCKNSPT